MEESITSQKFAHFLSHHRENPPPPNFYPPPLNINFYVLIQEKLHFFLCGWCHCCCTIFILTLYSLYTIAVLVLILINVQCLQNVVFSFEKGSNSQNHSLSVSQKPIKNFLYSEICNCPHLGKFHLPLSTDFVET